MATKVNSASLNFRQSQTACENFLFWENTLATCIFSRFASSEFLTTRLDLLSLPARFQPFSLTPWCDFTRCCQTRDSLSSAQVRGSSTGWRRRLEENNDSLLKTSKGEGNLSEQPHSSRISFHGFQAPGGAAPRLAPAMLLDS